MWQVDDRGSWCSSDFFGTGNITSVYSIWSKKMPCLCHVSDLEIHPDAPGCASAASVNYNLTTTMSKSLVHPTSAINPQSSCYLLMKVWLPTCQPPILYTGQFNCWPTDTADSFCWVLIHIESDSRNLWQHKGIPWKLPQACGVPFNQEVACKPGRQTDPT